MTGKVMDPSRWNSCLASTKPVPLVFSFSHRYLTSASYSNGGVQSYTYDAVGNQQTMVSPSGTITYTYDAVNRLANAAGVDYTWDDKGNPIFDGVRSYEYDYANRLMEVTDSILTTQFAYNGDGVGMSKTTESATTQ